MGFGHPFSSPLLRPLERKSHPPMRLPSPKKRRSFGALFVSELAAEGPLITDPRILNPRSRRPSTCRAKCDLHGLRNGTCCGCPERRWFQWSFSASRCSSRDPRSFRRSPAQKHHQRPRVPQVRYPSWFRRLSRPSRRLAGEHGRQQSRDRFRPVVTWRVPRSRPIRGVRSAPHQARRWPAGLDVC